MENINKKEIRKEVKRGYQKPTIKVLGSLASLTLKTGSVSDFGSNQFQP